MFTNLPGTLMNGLNSSFQKPLSRLAGRVLMAFSAAAALGCSVAAAQDRLDLSQFRQTFVEDFKTLDVSADGPGTRWTAHTPWHGDFGDAAFDNPGPGGPFSLTPEGLSITAHQDGKGKWHGGLLASYNSQGVGSRGFAQQYGYFEMKAKFPSGAGVWPAFWLCGVQKATLAPELDVVEFYGQFPRYFHSTVHIWNNGKGILGQEKMTEVPSGQLSDQYNTYGVLVMPDQTTFYLNRQKIWTTPTMPPWRAPLGILVNLALGGGWPITALKSPQVMQVEYVKVWQAPGL